jgi:hypothetical protein
VTGTICRIVLPVEALGDLLSMDKDINSFYTKHPRTKEEKAIQSTGISATIRRIPQGEATEEPKVLARELLSGDDQKLRSTSRARGTNHFALQRLRAPATRSEQGLLTGG